MLPLLGTVGRSRYMYMALLLVNYRKIEGPGIMPLTIYLMYSLVPRPLPRFHACNIENVGVAWGPGYVHLRW